MNEEVKTLWTEALRSGEFEQGRGALTVIDGGDRYCCLGVLCKVAIANGLDIKVTPEEERVWYDHESAYLPRSVRDWAGLETSDPLLGEHAASAWNDDEHADFTKIADLIDAHL
jgi:hypothetical protein